MAAARQPLAQVLRTKLYRPRLTAELVRRDRLCALVDQADETKLTLVSAPAGFGKSILVSQWIERRENPAAWLSLDESETDLRSFLGHVLAAIDTVAPGACQTTRDLLEGPSLPPVPVVAGHLINDLDALSTPCAIVLDDYHRIGATSPVHDLMTRVLDFPPRPVHIVIITRQDPPIALAGLRADRRVSEVRLQDLRFTDSETAAFLAAATELSLSEQALENLQHEMEGWAVGLRLVALALRYATDPDEFLTGMRGGLPRAQEYLVQEVLGALSPEIRDCLLASSVLDRFCEDLLTTICGPPASAGKAGTAAEEFMVELRRSTLFTISLDAKGEWYRYHHLFQDLTVNELHRIHGPERVAELNTIASGWFEENGLLDEALKHAMAAADVERAARLVEDNRHPAIDNDRWYDLGRWLSLLPEDVVQQRPELLLARGWILLHHSRFETVPPLLERVDSLLDDRPDHDRLRGEIALFWGYMLFFLGDGTTSLQYMETALEKIPGTCDEARAQCEVIRALSKQMVGRQRDGLRDLDELVAAYTSPTNLRMTRLLVTYVFIHSISGELDRAEAANRLLRDVAERDRYAYALAWCIYLQGIIHLYRGELEAAATCLERTVAQRFIHFNRAAVDAITALMLTYHALGRTVDAQDTLQLMRDYVDALNDPTYLAFTDLAEVRLAILKDQPDTAAGWLRSAVLPPPEAMLWWVEVPLVTRCRALIGAGSAAHLEEAEQQLRECVALNEAHHNNLHRIEALVLLAVALAKQGKADEAIGSLRSAVNLARQGGMVYPFLEFAQPLAGMLGTLMADSESAGFIDRIFSALGGAAAAAESDPPEKPGVRSATAPGLLDDLTDRELEVLALLGNRLQDKEIAERLEISHHTVKHHLKQIYEKLDVHGRRQAVRRAREIGLLGSDASS